jgi:hypothetical protein
LTLSNTSSFLTSISYIQLIFSILLQHHRFIQDGKIFAYKVSTVTIFP